MIYSLIFVFGAIIGSFLNVCIYRIPRKISVVFPSSRCVSCKKSISWYDNIPFLSYILLKGRCRSCGAQISSRYFAVEFISAAVFLLLFINFRLTHLFWIYSLVTFSLIVVTFIDIEFQIIPDRISIGGIVLGIIVSALMPQIHNSPTWKGGLVDSFLGLAVGGGLIYITGFLGNIAFKKESMGGGDVKLMAMLGSFLGWKMAILIFFLAPFLGTPVGVYLKFMKKQDVIPYAPFISMASFVAMLWGYKILNLLLL